MYSTPNDIIVGSFLKTSFSIVMFNIGDICGDIEWNKNRWNKILETILSKQSDIIILHEITNPSEIFFDQLIEKGYISYVPYISNISHHHKRDNWEVIYSKYPIHNFKYYPFHNSHGISCGKILIGSKHTTFFSLNLHVATWNPSSRKELFYFRDLAEKYINPKMTSIMALSTGNFGSYIFPFKSMIDVWTILGSPKNLLTTLNPKTCVYISPDNRRADHIWVSNLKPQLISPIEVDIESEHIGIHVCCRFNQSCFKHKKIKTDNIDEIAYKNQLKYYEQQKFSTYDDIEISLPKIKDDPTKPLYNTCLEPSHSPKFIRRYTRSLPKNIEIDDMDNIIRDFTDISFHQPISDDSNMNNNCKDRTVKFKEKLLESSIQDFIQNSTQNKTHKKIKYKSRSCRGNNNSQNKNHKKIKYKSRSCRGDNLHRSKQYNKVKNNHNKITPKSQKPNTRYIPEICDSLELFTKNQHSNLLPKRALLETSTDTSSETFSNDIRQNYTEQSIKNLENNTLSENSDSDIQQNNTEKLNNYIQQNTTITSDNFSVNSVEETLSETRHKKKYKIKIKYKRKNINKSCSAM